jgi:GNAT superfamily N-acetyltransferase
VSQTIQTPAGDVRIRLGTAAELIGLRHAILRPGLPRETAIFDDDEHPQTRHVVALLGKDRVVGCATVIPSTWDGAAAWQLRAMATAPVVRGTGVGRAVLTYVENLLLAHTDTHLLWCHARVSAVGFYEKLGWRVVSEVLDIPPAGPHVKMTKSL